MFVESLDLKDQPGSITPQAKGWGVFSGTFWAVLAFLSPQLLIAPLLPALTELSLSQNTKLFVLQMMIQSLTVIMIAAIIYAYRLSLTDIGIGRFRLKYLGWAIMIFPVYLLTSLVLTNIMSIFFPYILEQEQEIGFITPQGIELGLIFVALVVVAPIVEEIIFRGFMFCAYHRRFGAFFGAILVSVLFGLAHGQLSVGLDTFALSMFLCYVRIKGDSLWPPILLHAFKNFVAFYFLFIIGSK